jgi:hypothetical protein
LIRRIAEHYTELLKNFYEAALMDNRPSNFSNVSSFQAAQIHKELNQNIKFVIEKLIAFGQQQGADTPQKFKSAVDFHPAGSPFAKNRRLNSSVEDFSKLLSMQTDTSNQMNDLTFGNKTFRR